MSLHPDSEKKIMDLGPFAARGFADVAKAVAYETEQQNLPSGAMVIPMYDENSDLKIGDLVAEIHVVVRRVA